MPWQEAVKSESFLTTCMDNSQSLFVYLYGWEYEFIACSPDKVKAKLKIEPNGQIKNVLAHFPDAAISIDGDTVFVSQDVSIKKISTKVPPESLPGMRKSIIRLNQNAQEYDLNLTLSPKKVGAEEPKLPGKGGNKNKTKKPYKALNVTASSETTGLKLLVNLVDSSGFVIETINATTPGKWEIKGVQYVKK
jgi:hypothetical protein